MDKVDKKNEKYEKFKELDVAYIYFTIAKFLIWLKYESR